MKLLRFPLALFGLLGFASAGLDAADSGPGHEHHTHAAALTDAQKEFLRVYEAIRVALVRDDLVGAKAAAEKLPDVPAVFQIARINSIEVARMSFKRLSERAVSLATGQPGYYVAYCPMADSQWVQPTTAIGNPYLGVKSPTCGRVQS